MAIKITHLAHENNDAGQDIKRSKDSFSGKQCSTWLKNHVAFICWLTICFSSLLAVTIANALTAGKNPWGDAAIDNKTFRCEETEIGNLLREPVNSYSNFSFYFAGSYIFIAGVVDSLLLTQDYELTRKKNQLNIGHFPFTHFFIGCSLIFLSITSLCYHASAGKGGPVITLRDADEDGQNQTSLSAYLDMVGVFLTVFAISGAAVLNLGVTSGFLSRETTSRNRIVSVCLWVWFATSSIVAAEWKLFFSEYMWFLLYFALAIFIILLGSLCMSMYYARDRQLTNDHDKILAPLSIVSCFIAIAAWVPEEILKICVIDNIELHAVWHSFLGICIFLAFVWARALDRKETFWQVTLFHYQL